MTPDKPRPKYTPEEMAQFIAEHAKQKPRSELTPLKNKWPFEQPEPPTPLKPERPLEEVKLRSEERMAEEERAREMLPDLSAVSLVYQELAAWFDQAKLVKQSLMFSAAQYRRSQERKEEAEKRGEQLPKEIQRIRTCLRSVFIRLAKRCPNYLPLTTGDVLSLLSRDLLPVLNYFLDNVREALEQENGSNAAQRDRGRLARPSILQEDPTLSLDTETLQQVMDKAFEQAGTTSEKLIKKVEFVPGAHQVALQEYRTAHYPRERLDALIQLLAHGERRVFALPTGERDRGKQLYSHEDIERLERVLTQAKDWIRRLIERYDLTLEELGEAFPEDLFSERLRFEKWEKRDAAWKEKLEREREEERPKVQTVEIKGQRVRYLPSPVSDELPLGTKRQSLHGENWEIIGKHGRQLVLRADSGTRYRMASPEHFLKWKKIETSLFSLPPKGAEEAQLEQAIEVLGRENVHGLEDVEFALGFKLDHAKIPPIPYTEKDLQKSKELKEQGIEEMLVLFVLDQDETRLTGERMNVLLQQKYTELNLGQFLNRASNWYPDEDFYKKRGLKYEWKLITKRCIPDSKSKRHHRNSGDDYRYEDTQEYAIDQFGYRYGVRRDILSRPEPFQMLYAVALHFVASQRLKKNRGERLLVDEYHWSNTRSSGGNFVRVGFADRDGAIVFGGSRDYRDEALGVCLSRDPA